MPPATPLGSLDPGSAGVGRRGFWKKRKKGCGRTPSWEFLLALPLP